MYTIIKFMPEETAPMAAIVARDKIYEITGFKCTGEIIDFCDSLEQAQVKLNNIARILDGIIQDLAYDPNKKQIYTPDCKFEIKQLN